MFNSCSVEACPNKYARAGFCSTHYKRNRLHGDPLVAIADKKCERCGDNYTPNSSRQKRCSTCQPLYIKEYNASYFPEYSKENPDRKVIWRLAQYNLTIEEYENKLRKQNYQCEICKDVVSTQNSAVTSGLRVDHDHACCSGTGKSCGNCLRGLLCNNCNTVLGFFSDDIERFESAIEYLKKYQR